jgi:DNA-binding response OmpR family regulator
MTIPHVLLVEDNEHIRRIYCSKLQTEGFKVTIAEDGEQGLLWAEVCAPDVILLDIMMPKMDGFEVLQRLRDHPYLNRIPVFMLSNKAWADDVNKALSLGAREFFTKGSSTLQNIVTQIRNACGFKKLIVITSNVEAGKPISATLQHPKLLCGASAILAEAVPAVVRRQPDLVVFDARLGDANVFAILQQLKATPSTKAIPVIAITNDPQRFRGIEGSVAPAQIDHDLRPLVLKLLGLTEATETAPMPSAKAA